MFNWLKLKMISPSVLHRNRLYIERDSKTRRVMTNFGLTFRNSKWSDYSLNNVNLYSLEKFKRFMSTLIGGLSLFLFLFLLNASGFYVIDLPTFIICKEAVWLYYDWATLSLFTCIFSYSYPLQASFNWLVQVFLGKVFTTTVSRSASLTTPSQSPSSYPQPTPSTFGLTQESKLETYWDQLPAEWRKVIAVTWLEESGWSPSFKTFWTWQFYQSTDSSLQIKKSKFFLKRLYKAADQVAKVQTRFPVELTNNFFDSPFVKLMQSSTPLSMQYFTPLLTFKDSSPSQNSSGVPVFKHLARWNLARYNQEFQNPLVTTTWRLGAFYSTHLNLWSVNAKKRSTLLTSLVNDSLTQQVKFLKWMRWLYRYNILHRNVIYNSHKVTSIKKLLSSGFFKSRLAHQNLWASNFFARNPSISLQMPAYMQSLYGDTIQGSGGNSSHLRSESGKLNPYYRLSVYEKSYFYYLHRFQYFNTLPSLTISANLKLAGNNSNVESSATGNAMQVSYVTNSLLKSYTLTNHPLNWSSQRLSPSAPSSTPSAFYSDQVYLEDQRSFLADLPTLNILTTLLEMPSSTTNSFLYIPHYFATIQNHSSGSYSWQPSESNYVSQTRYVMPVLETQYLRDLETLLR